MKVTYISATCISDAEFPLIKEFLNKGIDVDYYVPLRNINLTSGLFDIKKQIPQTKICTAADYPEMDLYSDFIDLKKIKIVNLVDHRLRNPKTIYIWLKLFIKILFSKPDVVHIGWPFSKLGKIVYYLPFPRVITIHDPFKHSSNTSDKEEKDRIFSFKKSDKIFLLSTPQAQQFCDYYKIPNQKIAINKLGEYSAARGLKAIEPNIDSPYILFFGLISGYKGLEYLCDAMIDVHKKHPNIKLVIAGGGNLYFNYSKFEKLDYFILKNNYISVQELSGLLKNCLFTVCPYKDATQSGVVQTAFTMGAPAIVTNVGALPKAVKDGETGLVIPPCDSNAIADACCKLIENPSLLNQMRRNIVDIWQKEMSWGPIADKYIEVYEELIKK